MNNINSLMTTTFLEPQCLNYTMDRDHFDTEVVMEYWVGSEVWFLFCLYSDITNVQSKVVA